MYNLALFCKYPIPIDGILPIDSACNILIKRSHLYPALKPEEVNIKLAKQIMAKNAKKTSKVTRQTTTARVTRSERDEPSFLQRVQKELNLNQSYLSLVLGLLIVLVAGVLVFNYFKGNKDDLIPAQQAENNQQTADVSPENLPGKYTVKEGDTLYTIAENYYKDGFKYSEIVKANNLTDENNLTVGQVIEIPKVESQAAEQPQATPSPATQTQVADQDVVTPQGEGTGGAVNQTIWGERITSDTYTVVEGDWLSTIAGRAYGDVMAYEKIAAANNIADVDVIVPGQTLKIPR